MRVAMLSQTQWRHDSRVIREAETLAEAGHDVHVVCRSAVGASDGDEWNRGVHYVSIARIMSERPDDLFALVRGHVDVLRLDASRLFRGPRRGRSLLSALQLAGFLVGTPLAAAVVGGLWLRRGRGRTVLRRVGGKLVDHLDAIRHLNDYGRACTPTVVALEPDVVHAHDLVTLAAAASYARRAGIRLVYDAHELETHTNYKLLENPVGKRLISEYEFTLIRRCNATVTVCDSIADWLADRYVIARPVVVMNAASRRDALTDAGSLRKMLGLEPDVALVVYVGSVTFDRGLELTVDALARLPGVHLATVGWRYPETVEAMTRIATDRGVLDRLHFVDPVPSDRVVSFIADADASVIPIQNVCLSYAFAFPNKLLESVFAGLPVAAADLIEIRRFMETFRVGLVMDETDPRSIADTLRELITHRSEYAPTEEDLMEIDAHYGWETQEARLLALYRALDPGVPAATTASPVASSRPAA